MRTAYQRAYREANRERLAAYQRDLAARRQRFLTAVKETAGCIDCGTSEGQLDFDHRDGEEKLFIISARKRSPLSVLVTEIEKCDVRCVSCHARRHWPEKEARMR